MKCLLCAIAILLCSECYGRNKTLVIIFGETRGHELTYENIEKNLINAVGADTDLALCIGVHENYNYGNPFYRNAKYKFTYPEPFDSGTAFDFACETI